MKGNPDSGFRINPRKFCLWNPESGKICLWNLSFWVLESEIQLKESAIDLLNIGIQNPSSIDKYLNPVSGIRSPRRGIQNPRSLTWNDVKCWKINLGLNYFVRGWQDKTIFYLGSYTSWNIDFFPNNLKLQSSMLSYLFHSTYHFVTNSDSQIHWEGGGLINGWGRGGGLYPD